MAARRYKYDVAFSFAGEDRTRVEPLAITLRDAGYSVFYDRFEAAELLGEDLPAKLQDVYEKHSRFCVVVVSATYVKKEWTRHELKAAVSRLIKSRGAYILPLRLDGSDAPGLPRTTGFIDLRHTPESEVASLLAQKLGPVGGSRAPRPRGAGDHNDGAQVIKEVLSLCYRRAVFARVHAQISLSAMYASLSDCRSSLQKLIVSVAHDEAQRLVAGIVGELDFLERRQNVPGDWWTENAPEINGAKMRIISSLIRLSRIAKIPYNLPTSIVEDAFFGKEDADAPLDPDPRWTPTSSPTAPGI